MKVTIENYQELAWSTCCDESKNLMYLGLGLGDESGEFLEKVAMYASYLDKGKELSDVCWYVAGICTIKSYSFEEIVRFSRLGIHPVQSSLKNYSIWLQVNCSKVQGICKKEIRDKTIKDELLKSLLVAIVSYIEKIANKYLGLSLEDVLSINIDKLSSRAKRGKIQGDGDNR